MQIDARYEGDTLVLHLAGDWSIDQPLKRFVPPFSEWEERGPVRAIGFDASQLGHWDSSLLTYVLDTMQFCASNGIRFRGDTLPENIAGLIELSQAVPEADLIDQQKDNGLLASVGRAGIKIFQEMTAFARFTGEFAQTFTGFLFGRVKLRWRAFLGDCPVQHIGRAAHRYAHQFFGWSHPFFSRRGCVKAIWGGLLRVLSGELRYFARIGGVDDSHHYGRPHRGCVCC